VALMAHAPLASIAMSSSFALMASLLLSLMRNLPDALPIQSAQLTTTAMSSTGVSQVLQEPQTKSPLDALPTQSALPITTAMSSTGAFQVPLGPKTRNQPDALPTQSALPITTAMNSTGASQVLLEGPVLVLDAELMAHAPLASIAMSSSFALMVHLRPSFSE
jgi:hypothetical protein